MSHRFEEIESDEEVDTPTTRPTHTHYHDDDNEIPIHRTNRSSNRRTNRFRRDPFGSIEEDFFGGGFGRRRDTRRRGRSGAGGSMLSSFFDDDDFFGGGFGSMMNGFDRMHRQMESMMRDSMDSGNGRNGSYGYSSTKRIVSRNGVTEETSQEQDSSGRRKVRVRRRIGDRGSQVDKELEPDGTERTTKRLHNMREEEEPDFDQQWEQMGGSRFGLESRNADRRHAIGHH